MRRAKQPSTYAGIAGILQGAKAFLPQYSMYFDIASMVAGSIAAAVHETGTPAKTTGK